MSRACGMEVSAARASLLWVWVTAIILAGRPLCVAQAEQTDTGINSPLKGYGTPGPNTTEVYVSAYLDRLLSVNDRAYQFDSIMYIYLSWVDPEARLKMENATSRMRDESLDYTCRMPCSSHADHTRCCDGIYLPGFYFKNAYAYSMISYDTYFIGDSSVLREVRVQGTYYQAMNFKKFPFDSFDLLTELRFKDTTRDINASSYGFGDTGSGRARLKVVPSSGDKKLFNLGAGDDANNWQVVGLCLNKYNLSLQDGVKYSERYSAAGDTVPLWPDLTNLGTGFFPNFGPANLLLRQDDDIIGVYITVSRIGRSSWMNGILPVLVVFILGLLIFVLDFEDETHLYNRLQLVVTLLLSLIAVQFVLVDKLPSSSYITPMQQLVLTTYIFLCCVSLESILLHCYVANSKKAIWATTRTIVLLPWWLVSAALRPVLRKGKPPPKLTPPSHGAAAEKPLQSPGATFTAVLDDSEDVQPFGSLTSFHSDSAQEQQQKQAFASSSSSPQPRRVLSPSRLKARLLTWSNSLGELCLCDSGACPCKQGPCPCKEGNCPCTAAACDCRLGRCPCRARRHDAIRRKRTADLIDNIVVVALAAGYTIAAVLIFTLQSGYTSLFPETDDRGATACPRLT